MKLEKLRSILFAAAAVAMLWSEPALAHYPRAQASKAQSASSAAAVESRRSLVGTVHELIVDDATKATSTRYVELEADDGTLVPLRGSLAAQLVRGARVEISGRDDGKRLDVDAATTIAPPAAAPKATADVEGTFALLHADDFAQGRSAYVYEVHQASGRIDRLRMGFLPASLAPGAHVRVTGRAESDGTTLTPERITILAPPATSSAGGTTAKAATANSVLLIMANFSNTGVPALTTTQAQQVMTTNADSVANYFREASYGQQLMNVTVTGWVTMTLAQPTSCGTTDWQAIGAAAGTAAKTLGSAYDPANFNFVVYLFPSVPACGWIGLGYVGAPHKAWINGIGAFRTQVITHEMGHNFGLLHAGSLNCGAAVIGGSCSVAEYGDPFDTMGNQRSMHYNAMQKSKLAWIAPSSVTTHTAGTATYTLTPIEVAGGATYAIRIPTSSANRTYWVEFRQPIGFDAPLSAFPNNGAEVRVATPFETYCSGCDNWSDDTQLLDMTPGNGSFTDATLPAGQTYSDTGTGINVTVLSAAASGLTVQVSVGGAAPPLTSTSTTLGTTANPALTGAMITFTATVTGNAPTGSVRFTDNGNVIAGCAAVAVSGSGAACSTNALTTGSHAIVAAYSGDSGNLASTSSAFSEVIQAPANGTNVALLSNGGTATASSTYSAAYAPLYMIDDRRTGAPWGNGGGWNDATPGAWPDWVQINFSGPKTIDHVVVYSLQDNPQGLLEPTDTMTFTLYGLTSFDVQGWNGSAWVTLGSVSGNNLVKRIVTFSPYTTDRIRVVVTGALRNWSRITEVEAWTSSTPSAETNYALAANGGVASASSTHDPGYAPSYAIDNLRTGASWGSGGGWNDATPGSWPDWIQVNFSATRTIDHVVVYSLQDDLLNLVEPTDTMTFSLYGLTAFDVQGWNGAGWTTLASVGGNNLVKRSVWFTPYATDRIRINVTGALKNWSRVTEIEAWGR